MITASLPLPHQRSVTAIATVTAFLLYGTDAGYDAFLVGGCVRDLLLKKTPKDFDVVTTASLKQVFDIWFGIFF